MSAQAKTAEGVGESFIARLIHRWGFKDEPEFVLRVVQPALVGMIDGTVSSLAPIFAAAAASSQKPGSPICVSSACARSASEAGSKIVREQLQLVADRREARRRRLFSGGTRHDLGSVALLELLARPAPARLVAANVAARLGAVPRQ